MDSIYALRYRKLVPEQFETKMGEVLRLMFPYHEESVKAMMTDDDEFEWGYIQISREHAMLMQGVFNQFEVVNEMTDVTHSILMGDEWERINHHFSEWEYSWIKIFIQEHLTMDFVLDKITERGISALNEWDWLILKAAKE